MENISLLTYTHSSCTDVHKMYFDSINSFFNIQKHYVLTNSHINDDRITEIIYDEKDDYYQQMLLGLSNIETDFIIYSQEDYILYDFVDDNELSNCMNILNNNDDLMFVRLINSGLEGNELEYDNNFWKLNNESEYFFSTQITIWKKHFLWKMFEQSKTKTIFEETKNSSFLRLIGGIGICTKLRGEKIGGHYNSLIYPYIAAAIIRRKWNFSEYEVKLEPLLNRYEIDKNIRGII